MMRAIGMNSDKLGNVRSLKLRVSGGGDQVFEQLISRVLLQFKVVESQTMETLDQSSVQNP